MPKFVNKLDIVEKATQRNDPCILSHNDKQTYKVRAIIENPYCIFAIEIESRINLYLYKYENVCLCVCVSVYSRFSRQFGN